MNWTFPLIWWLISGPVTAESLVSIPEIQGASHISPFDGKEVTTTGVVTLIASDRIYIQDSQGDGDDCTSDGILVFSADNPQVALGDLLEVTGEVSEFIPGGAETGNLSITEFIRPAVRVLSSGNVLPAPVLLGRGGRIPPNRYVISKDEIDSPINLQNAVDDAENRFDPGQDGIDFYESLEGMRVTVQNPVAVSPTRTFGPSSSEFFVLTDNGENIAPLWARTERGGINLQPHPDNRGDQNPERIQIQLDGTLLPGELPSISVGDRLSDVTGVVDYSFGNFEVIATGNFDIISGDLAAETTSLVGGSHHLTVASYNILNHSAVSRDNNQRLRLASQIVNHLKSPDIIALQEVQDNNGDTDKGPDGVVDATVTLRALRNAVVSSGGPSYEFLDVAPVEGTSGGIPGGNVRNAFLYNPERVDLVEFESLTPQVLTVAGVANSNAFEGTRNPLQATFRFNGNEVIILNNHLTSRSGSTPIFGGLQPFIQAGEEQREAQVQTLNDYVDSLLKVDSTARIVVLGDLNTFQFSDDLLWLLTGIANGEWVLNNLLWKGFEDNRYSFNFEGNSQVLDHIFTTFNLFQSGKLDMVHLNVDFPRVEDSLASDHEPLVAQFWLP